MEHFPIIDLYYNHTFLAKINEFKKNILPEAYCMVAVDIEHFRLFNKLYGRDTGNELICYIGQCLKDSQELYNGIAGYLGGDNFGIIVPNDITIVEAIRDAITSGIKQWNHTIGFLPMLGVYVIDDITLPAEVIYDRATLAISHIPGKHSDRICYFDTKMESNLEEEVQLLSEIQDALEKEEFTFFAQPQCDISTGKIIGAEALVRWRHSTKGLISPGVFIPVLEKNGIIHRLDSYVWRKVCEWLRSWIDRGFTPVPISINISRIDVFSINVPEYLENLMTTYELPKKLLKVEITESAYSESNDKIDQTLQILRDSGFTVLMDDFGSGYSSLSMLKNVSVDVLKLDMRFLDMSEATEEKGVGILESIVNMARLMRLPIIVEGVETEKQEKFLMNMGCRYTQGYYYYKPLPIDQFEALLTDERQLDLNGLIYKQVEPLHIREFLDDNFFSDGMLNNVLGPVAFYEMYDNQIEVTRVNEQYFRLAGNTSSFQGNYSKRLWNHVRDDDRPLLYTIFENAYNNPLDGAEGCIHFLRADGKVLWVHLHVFFLKEHEGRKLFYSSVTDMTDLHEQSKKNMTIEHAIADLTSEDYQQMDNYFRNLPCGYVIAKVNLGEDNKVANFDIEYGNLEMKKMCAGNLEQLKSLALHAFADKQEEIYDLAYQAAYLGKTVSHFAYSRISSRYLQFTFYQYRYGYIGCTLDDVTHMYVHENALNSIMRSYREVYFVHLRDNYCRMLYPYENQIMERGNYEETINRHFHTGRILSYDEQNIRKFLSLDNLREVLLKQDTTEYAYRRSGGDISEEWCLTSFTVSERDKNGHPKTAIMVVRSIDSIMRESNSKKAQYLSETLASMSEGFFIYHAGEDEKILYANPKTLQIFGCETVHEFRKLVNRSFRGMVHPDDWARIDFEIRDQVEHSTRNMDYIQYRIIRKDGEVRWIEDFGHLENATIGAGGALFYVFISDITDTITEKQKNRLLARNKYYQREQ